MNIDNIDLLCRDVEKMVAFYHDILGLEFFLPYDPSQGWASLQAGAVTLYIFRTDSAVDAPPRVHVAREDPPGLSAFGLGVEDLDEAIASLDGKVTWAGDVRRWEHPTGTWYRFRPFYDPEGNVLSITEPHKVAQPAPVSQP